MRAVVQRVKSGKVTVDQITTGEVERGILILLAIHKDDKEDVITWLVEKCINLRIFEDENGKMNLSTLDINGDVLIVSQFTLYGDCSRGRRPSFTNSAAPDTAKKFYNIFVNEMKKRVKHVGTGKFGAMMEIDFINDGPVTLIVEK